MKKQRKERSRQKISRPVLSFPWLLPVEILPITSITYPPLNPPHRPHSVVFKNLTSTPPFRHPPILPSNLTHICTLPLPLYFLDYEISGYPLTLIPSPDLGLGLLYTRILSDILVAVIVVFLFFKFPLLFLLSKPHNLTLLLVLF